MVPDLRPPGVRPIAAGAPRAIEENPTPRSSSRFRRPRLLTAPKRDVLRPGGSWVCTFLEEPPPGGRKTAPFRSPKKSGTRRPLGASRERAGCGQQNVWESRRVEGEPGETSSCRSQLCANASLSSRKLPLYFLYIKPPKFCQFKKPTIPGWQFFINLLITIYQLLSISPSVPEPRPQISF